jgi:hypothetical protein
LLQLNKFQNFAAWCALLVATSFECSLVRAQAFELLKRQQQLETMLAEVQGSKPPELLLETTEELLARMKAKLVKT